MAKAHRLQRHKQHDRRHCKCLPNNCSSCFRGCSSSTSNTSAIGPTGKNRGLPLHASLNSSVTVPTWKLATIVMLTLCLGISLREVLPVVLSQDQLSIFLQEKTIPKDLTTSPGSIASAASAVDTLSGPTDLIRAEGTNRSIVLVHVGKAAGSTLRRATKVLCKTVKHPNNRHVNLKRTCSGKNARDQQSVPLTGKLIQDVFHMWGRNETLAALVTTYLVTVRNPVERIISTFRYSHPENCPKHEIHETILLPWGCQLHKNGKLTKPQTQAYQLFSTCFPSPAMEDFAQALGSPWEIDPSSHFAQNLTEAQQWKCRKIARGIVTGHGPANGGSMPHMEFNYKYYGEETFLRYPEKEIMVVRTSHEWDDLLKLDLLLGGTGIMKNPKREVTHGSDNFFPSPLSPTAYRKLCCALVEEIDLYATIVNRAVNLNPQSKKEALQEVYKTCSIVVEWEAWQLGCRKKMARDLAFLSKQNLAGVGEMETNKWGQGGKYLPANYKRDTNNPQVDWQPQATETQYTPDHPLDNHPPQQTPFWKYPH